MAYVPQTFIPWRLLYTVKKRGNHHVSTETGQSGILTVTDNVGTHEVEVANSIFRSIGATSENLLEMELPDRKFSYYTFEASADDPSVLPVLSAKFQGTRTK